LFRLALIPEIATHVSEAAVKQAIVEAGYTIA
jgi:hypothetical protein